METDSLTELTSFVAAGLPAPEGGAKKRLEALFGERFPKRHFTPTALRDAYGFASADNSEGVPYAGLINGDNPPSGPYGGTSVVWFPSPEGSLIDFGVGTRGLSPDEGILTRPGHRRRIAALRHYLATLGVESWTKPDPAALDVQVPKTVREHFREFDKVFQRYGSELYACARVPRDLEQARRVVQAFIDLYAYERDWEPMKAHQAEFNTFHAALRDSLFSSPSKKEVNALLRQRRFVVLQGPPGTGKTRMAEEVKKQFFDGRGMTVQFHPAVTYEDFIVGLSPDARDSSLRFGVRRGWLLEAALQARESPSPFLLVIDEVNRADLGKVLGEAIYLFEPGEVGGATPRSVRLAHPVDGQSSFELPSNLFVLATMNTADRSIASMDLAVRRRFAFMTLPPQRSVVEARSIPSATRAFDQISSVFVEHAPGDTLLLMPGHAYFLANSEEEFRDRLRYELIPLLDEYLSQGVLGAASTELAAVRDSLEDELKTHA